MQFPYKYQDWLKPWEAFCATLCEGFIFGKDVGVSELTAADFRQSNSEWRQVIERAERLIMIYSGSQAVITSFFNPGTAGPY